MAIAAPQRPTSEPAPSCPLPPRSRRRGGGAGAGLGRWSPYGFVAPFFVLFGVFGLYPLIYTAWVSLHHVELINPSSMTWVGLGNYVALVHNAYFWNALRNTFLLGVLSTVPQLMIALGLAQLLNYRARGRSFFRVAMLMPYATSVAAATIVFAQLFGRDYGLINWALGLVGVG
ncbi:MAG: carbohydrate ABC transporter permease, partial [Actinomycetes bacterium]